MELLILIIMWSLGLYFGFAAIVFGGMFLYAKVKGVDSLVKNTYGANSNFDRILWRMYPDRVAAEIGRRASESLKNNHND